MENSISNDFPTWNTSYITSFNHFGFCFSNNECFTMEIVLVRLPAQYAFLYSSSGEKNSDQTLKNQFSNKCVWNFIFVLWIYRWCYLIFSSFILVFKIHLNLKSQINLLTFFEIYHQFRRFRRLVTIVLIRWRYLVSHVETLSASTEKRCWIKQLLTFFRMFR